MHWTKKLKGNINVVSFWKLSKVFVWKEINAWNKKINWNFTMNFICWRYFFGNPDVFGEMERNDAWTCCRKLWTRETIAIEGIELSDDQLDGQIHETFEGKQGVGKEKSEYQGEETKDRGKHPKDDREGGDNHN